MTRRAPRLLYIIGASRSGSTILDAVLGNSRGIVATGELNQLLLDDVDEPRLCACGNLLEKCPFWGPVLDRWTKSLAPSHPDDYTRLQDHFERFRGLPRLAWASARRSPPFEVYSEGTAGLLAAIASVGASDLVADSSKNPVRAWALLRGGVVDMALIHLVRDPRAVTWSKVKLLRWRGLPPWLRSPVAVVLRSAFDWNVSNLTSDLIVRLRKDVPYVRVRYEDFAERPDDVLRKIAAVVHVDLDSLAQRAASGEIFAFSHVMAGNLARRRPPRLIAKDEAWRSEAPPWIRRITWALCGPLARRYGYRA